MPSALRRMPRSLGDEAPPAGSARHATHRHPRSRCTAHPATATTRRASGRGRLPVLPHTRLEPLVRTRSRRPAQIPTRAHSPAPACVPSEPRETADASAAGTPGSATPHPVNQGARRATRHRRARRRTRPAPTATRGGRARSAIDDPAHHEPRRRRRPSRPRRTRARSPWAGPSVKYRGATHA